MKYIISTHSIINMPCLNSFDGLLILRDTFNLTSEEIEDGHFLNKIRKDPDYINKFLKFNKNQIHAILYWCYDKFTLDEINKIFRGFLSDDFIQKYLV